MITITLNVATLRLVNKYFACSLLLLIRLKICSNNCQKPLGESDLDNLKCSISALKVVSLNCVHKVFSYL